MTPPKHAAALKFAVNNLGQHEQPMGSNTGPFVIQCQRATWLKGTKWPWCAAFCVRAWTVAGYKLPYLGAGAYATVDWYRKNLPAWTVGIGKARPGAMVVVKVGAGHMVMLEVADRKTETFSAIGGNQGDKVARAIWRWDQVYGIVDPPETEVSPPVVAKKPVFEVVTSDSGHKIVYVSGVKAISNKLPQILKRHRGGVAIRPKK